MNDPMPQVGVQKHHLLFETKLAFLRYFVEEPRHLGNVLAETCYLYRGTRQYSLP